MNALGGYREKRVSTSARWKGICCYLFRNVHHWASLWFVAPWYLNSRARFTSVVFKDATVNRSQKISPNKFACNQVIVLVRLQPDELHTNKPNLESRRDIFRLWSTHTRRAIILRWPHSYGTQRTCRGVSTQSGGGCPNTCPDTHGVLKW